MLMLTRLLALGLTLMSLAQAGEKAGHLFILSGQSNMTGNLKKGFQETVTKTLGEEQVSLVHCSRGGRGIRFWVADYALPEDHPMTALSKNKSNGEEFTRLVKAVKDAYDATSFKTVHLIWMQGESDANRDLGAAYERSFKVLVERLEKELGVEEMHFVIGRISDYGLFNDKKEAWTRMRTVQEKLGDEDSRGAWIDTDDFIPKTEKHPKGDLHYPSEESVQLGERFGQAALQQIEAK